MYPTIKSDNITYYENALGHGIVLSPTANCQIASIRCAYKIFQLSSEEEILLYLKDIYRHTQKNNILVDIHNVSGYTDKIRKIFKNCIILESSYKSTNNNEMIIFILNIHKLFYNE